MVMLFFFSIGPQTDLVHEFDSISPYYMLPYYMLPYYMLPYYMLPYYMLPYYMLPYYMLYNNVL